MGSLMAGWDSPVEDPKSVMYRRNRSLTRGEIDAYWRSKKKIEEEHLRAISSPLNTSQDGTYKEVTGTNIRRSSSVPATARGKLGSTDMDSEKNMEKLILKNGWWTRSNWAFLNEPPVLERSANNYTTQFHVANIANSKADSGIST